MVHLHVHAQAVMVKGAAAAYRARRDELPFNDVVPAPPTPTQALQRRRCGRHIARTKRYIRNFAHEIEPDQLVEYVRGEARAGDGWVKLVGDWIDRDVGDLRPLWPVSVSKCGCRPSCQQP